MSDIANIILLVIAFGGMITWGLLFNKWQSIRWTAFAWLMFVICTGWFLGKLVVLTL